MYRPGLAWPLVLLSILYAGLSQASPNFKNLKTDAFQTLEDYQRDSKWLVVMIWASDCEICKREAGSYQRFHTRSEQIATRVIGLTLDGSEREADARKFVARYGLEFDNLLAEPETVMAYYQLLTGSRWVGTPSFLVFGPEGELMAKQAGAVEPEIIENFIAANSTGS